MINSHELLDNLDRSLRNNDLKSIQTDVSRLKTISPGSWQKKCSSQEPLIQISDSVLTDVKIILNINQIFNDVIAGDENPEHVYSNLGGLKATLNNITKQLSKKPNYGWALQKLIDGCNNLCWQLKIALKSGKS